MITETLDAIFSLPKLFKCRPCRVKNFLSVSTVTINTCSYGFIQFSVTSFCFIPVDRVEEEHTSGRCLCYYLIERSSRSVSNVRGSCVVSQGSC